MDDNQVHFEVARRNGASVAEALQRQDAIIREQGKRIDELSQGLSSFAARLAEMERMVAVQRATAIGRGPTVSS